MQGKPFAQCLGDSKHSVSGGYSYLTLWTCLSFTVICDYLEHQFPFQRTPLDWWWSSETSSRPAVIPGMTPPPEPGQEEECGGRALSWSPQGYACLLQSASSCSSSVSDLLGACPHILSGGRHSPTKCCEDPSTVYIWMGSIENCLGSLRKHWCLGSTLKILLYFTWSGAQASAFLKSSPCDDNGYLGWEALGQHISGLLCKISSSFCFYCGPTACCLVASAYKLSSILWWTSWWLYHGVLGAGSALKYD